VDGITSVAISGVNHSRKSEIDIPINGPPATPTIPEDHGGRKWRSHGFLPDWASTERVDDRLELPLAETELSVRTVDSLEEQGLFTVEDLLSCTPQQLLEILKALT
jgi:hypothetical protein